MSVFKDKWNDTLEVDPGENGTVSLSISYRDSDEPPVEAWLDPEVAMDVAAAIVRAVHG